MKSKSNLNSRKFPSRPRVQKQKSIKRKFRLNRKPRRFKVAQTIRLGGVPVLKRKIKTISQ